MGPSGHKPVDNPRNSGGLADPATRPYGYTCGTKGVFLNLIAQFFEDIYLPTIRAVVVA